MVWTRRATGMGRPYSILDCMACCLIELLSVSYASVTLVALLLT